MAVRVWTEAEPGNLLPGVLGVPREIVPGLLDPLGADLAQVASEFLKSGP